MGLTGEQLLEVSVPLADCATDRPFFQDASVCSMQPSKGRSKGLCVTFSLIVREVRLGEDPSRTASELLDEASTTAKAQAFKLAAEAAARSAEASQWREAKTADGTEYFYHVRTRETSWERPKVTAAATVAAHGCCVGDLVEVWSNARQDWCAGYVERLTQESIFVVFQLPGERSNEWCKKELPPGDESMRELPHERRPHKEN